MPFCGITKCCCCVDHRRGVMALGWITIVLSILGIVAFFGGLKRGPNYGGREADGFGRSGEFFGRYLSKKI